MDWRETLNLAGWKYRSISEERTGPIREIEVNRSEIQDGQFGYTALATLQPQLRATKTYTNLLYGDVDGTGTSKYKYDAINICISEALERWAFYQSIQDPKYKIDLGFNIDPTTSGMSAFPGLFKKSSRAIALREAVERWSIVQWWTGNLSAVPIVNKQAIELCHPWTQTIKTLICWKYDQESRRWGYGFSSANNLDQALKRAGIEMLRNLRVLRWYASAQTEPSLKYTSIYERRLVYFSEDKGFLEFSDRKSKSFSTAKHLQQPSLIVDSEIKGPWSNYATIWRCLYDPGTREQFSDDSSFFYF